MARNRLRSIGYPDEVFPQTTTDQGAVTNQLGRSPGTPASTRSTPAVTSYNANPDRLAGLHPYDNYAQAAAILVKEGVIDEDDAWSVFEHTDTATIRVCNAPQVPSAFVVRRAPREARAVAYVEVDRKALLTVGASDVVAQFGADPLVELWCFLGASLTIELRRYSRSLPPRGSQWFDFAERIQRDGHDLLAQWKAVLSSMDYVESVEL